jgi:SET domain-containing protein
MGLMIRSSSIHAAGCYTTSPIAKGVKVVEYTGPRINKQEADARFRDPKITYLFGIGDGSIVINGFGMAMYINHSCDPNCETEELDGRIWVTSLRAIAPGEELTYDYNLYDGDEDEARCHCGASSCRKTMYSPEEIARRKRAARRKAVKSGKAVPRKQGKKAAGKGKKAAGAKALVRRK